MHWDLISLSMKLIYYGEAAWYSERNIQHKSEDIGSRPWAIVSGIIFTSVSLGSTILCILTLKYLK